MRRLAASFVLGYHGCDRTVADRLVEGEPFALSRNDYDWLGGGIYFWEANPRRGLAYAHRDAGRAGSRIVEPAVVGAIIDLGLCLDLTTMDGISLVREAHTSLKAQFDAAGLPLPINQDKLRRQLDRVVLDHVHNVLEWTDQPPIDSVRGVFTEGRPVYPGSGFDEETHIQIAVRNRDCIKGVFRVPDRHLKYD